MTIWPEALFGICGVIFLAVLLWGLCKAAVEPLDDEPYDWRSQRSLDQ